MGQRLIERGLSDNERKDVEESQLKGRREVGAASREGRGARESCLLFSYKMEKNDSFPLMDKMDWERNLDDAGERRKDCW